MVLVLVNACCNVVKDLAVRIVVMCRFWLVMAASLFCDVALRTGMLLLILYLDPWKHELSFDRKTRTHGLRVRLS